jgi:hypothetical protein
MTNEPWRNHGAELTTREPETQLLLADTDIRPRGRSPSTRPVSPPLRPGT